MAVVEWYRLEVALESTTKLPSDVQPRVGRRSGRALAVGRDGK